MHEFNDIRDLLNRRKDKCEELRQEELRREQERNNIIKDRYKDEVRHKFDMLYMRLMSELDKECSNPDPNRKFISVEDELHLPVILRNDEDKRKCSEEIFRIILESRRNNGFSIGVDIPDGNFTHTIKLKLSINL